MTGASWPAAARPCPCPEKGASHTSAYFEFQASLHVEMLLVAFVAPSLTSPWAQMLHAAPGASGPLEQAADAASGKSLEHGRCQTQTAPRRPDRLVKQTSLAPSCIPRAPQHSSSTLPSPWPGPDRPARPARQHIIESGLTPAINSKACDPVLSEPALSSLSNGGRCQACRACPHARQVTAFFSSGSAEHSFLALLANCATAGSGQANAHLPGSLSHH